MGPNAVYEYGGRVTHLRYGDDKVALCGKEPFLSFFWYPTLEIADKPLCKECEKLTDDRSSNS